MTTTGAWVARVDGVEVARGATREECASLALFAGFPEGLLLISYERDIPRR